MYDENPIHARWMPKLARGCKHISDVIDATRRRMFTGRSPGGPMSPSPCLRFDGACAEALAPYAAVFDDPAPEIRMFAKMPDAKTLYSAGFGKVEDRFGPHWRVPIDLPQRA